MILNNFRHPFLLSVLLLTGGVYLTSTPSIADANDQKNTDQSMIMVYATPSPETSFFVVDQSGNRSGWDAPKERMFKEISGSNILDESVEDPKPFYVLYINMPSMGHYNVIVAGAKEGPFKLVVRAYDQANNAKRFIFRGVAVPNREYSYILDYASEEIESSSMPPEDLSDRHK